MLPYADEPIKSAQTYLAGIQVTPKSRSTASRRHALLSLMIKFPGLYIKEACALLGINPRTVKRWAKDPDFKVAYRTTQSQRFVQLYQYLQDECPEPDLRRSIKCYLFNFDPNYRPVPKKKAGRMSLSEAWAILSRWT